MKRHEVKWSAASAGSPGTQAVVVSRLHRQRVQLIALYVVALSATGVAAQQIAPSPDVVSTRKLTIANTIDYAPFGYVDADGKPTGIIVTLATATAELLHAKLDIQRTPFPALIPGLASGRFKIAWETFSITSERLQYVDFVVFLQGGLAASAKPEQRDSFAGQWGLCGKNIGVSAGSASDFLIDKLGADCVSNGAPAIDKSLFNTSQDIIQAVLSGRVDARLDDASASSYFETVSNGQLVVLPTQYDVAPMGLAVAKHDAATAQMLVAALSVLFDNGVYQDVLKRYGMSSHAVAAPYLVDSIDDLRVE